MPLAFPVYTEEQEFQANPNDKSAEPPCLTLAFPGCPSTAAEIRVDLGGVQEPCSRKHRIGESAHSISCAEITADVVNLSDHEASPSSSCHKDDPSSQADSEDTFKIDVPTSSGDTNTEHALIVKSHRAVPIIPGFTICSCAPTEVTTCAAPEYSLYSSQKRFPCNAKPNPTLTANYAPPSRRRSSERGIDTRTSSSHYLARSKSVERTQHRPKLENRITVEEAESASLRCESCLSTIIKPETDHVAPSQPIWGDSIHGDTPCAVQVYDKASPDREKKQDHKFYKDKSLLQEICVEQLDPDVLTCCSPMFLQVPDLSVTLKSHRSPPAARSRAKGSRTIDQMFVDVMRILVSLESKVSRSSETLDNYESSEASSSGDKDHTANHRQTATQTAESSTTITTATASNTDCSNPSSPVIDQNTSEVFLCGSACTGAFSSLDCSERDFILNPEREDSDDALCSLCATKNQSSLVIDINNCRWFDDDDVVVEHGETLNFLDNGSSSDEASNEDSNEDPRSSPDKKKEPEDDEMKGPSVRDMVRTFQGMMAAPCPNSGTSAEQAEIRPPEGDLLDSHANCVENSKSSNFWSEHQATQSAQEERAKKISANTNKPDFESTQELSTSQVDQTVHVTVKHAAMARREHHVEKPISTRVSQEGLYSETASSAIKGLTGEATLHEQEERSNTQRNQIHDEVSNQCRENNEKVPIKLTPVDRTTALSSQRNSGCSHSTKNASNLLSSQREPFASASESSHVSPDNFPFPTAAELRESAQACLERARATFNRVRSRSFNPMISGFLDRAQRVKASAQKSWARTASFRELPFDVFPSRASEIIPIPGTSCLRADSATPDSDNPPRNNRVAEEVESDALISTTPVGSLRISGDDHPPIYCLKINYSGTIEERPLLVVQQDSGTSGQEVNKLQDVGDLEKDHQGLVGRQAEREESRDTIKGTPQPKQETDSEPGCSSCSTKLDQAPKKTAFKRCQESFTVQPFDHRSRALDVSSFRLRTPPLLSIKETDSPSEETQEMHPLDRRQSSVMDTQAGFNTVISPDTEANSDERRYLHSFPSNATTNLLSEGSLRICDRASLTPVKSHSLIEATDTKRPDANDVKEVMNLINQEVHLKRYPSFQDLTNLDNLDSGVVSTLDPLLSSSLAKTEPTESVLVQIVDSPVASEPLKLPCIKAELDVEPQERDGNLGEASVLQDAEHLHMSARTSLPEEPLSTLGQDELLSIDASQKDQIHRGLQTEHAQLQPFINNEPLTAHPGNERITPSKQPEAEKIDGQIVSKSPGTSENLVKIAPTTEDVTNLLPDLPSPPSHSLSDSSWEDEADFFQADLASDGRFLHDIEGNLIQSTSRALPEAFPLFNRSRRHVVATVPKTGYPFQEETSSGLASIDSTLDSISLDDKQLLDNSDLTPLVHTLGGLPKDDSENSDLSLITLNCMEYLRDAQEPQYTNLSDEGAVGIISTDDESKSLEELVDPGVEIPPVSAPHREAHGVFLRRSTETMSLTNVAGPDTTLKRRGQSYTTLTSSPQNENKTPLITSSHVRPQDQPLLQESNSRKLTSGMLSPQKSSTGTEQPHKSSKLGDHQSSPQQNIPDVTTSFLQRQLRCSFEDSGHAPSLKPLLVIEQLSPRTTKSNSFESPPENCPPETESQLTFAPGFSSRHQQELGSSDTVLHMALTDKLPGSVPEPESHKTYQNNVNSEKTCLTEPKSSMVSSSGCSTHLPSAMRSSRDPDVDAVGPSPEAEPRRKNPKRIRWLEDTENHSDNSSE